MRKHFVFVGLPVGYKSQEQIQQQHDLDLGLLLALQEWADSQGMTMRFNAK